MNKLSASLAAIILAVSLSACTSKSNEPETRNVECDVDDQAEHDSDCGYYDDDDNWVWYPFVVLGQSTNGVADHPAQDEGEEGGHHSKPKKKATKKPTIKATPKKVSTTKRK